MKQGLLLGLMIFISCLASAQVQGPPPPCGYFPVYRCDYDNDGIDIFNLVELYPFSTFCAVNTGEAEKNYGQITYYLSREDLNSEINPIIHPENFINTSREQEIFFRANAINDGAGFEYLSHGDLIEVLDVPSPKTPSTYILCDYNNDGYNVFDLTSKNDEILAGLNPDKYIVKYYETLYNAENDIDNIANTYTNNVNPQVLYVRVCNFVMPSCYKIVELNLEVQDNCNDIGVYLVSTSELRPGFQYRNELIVKNLSSSVQSGKVKFEFDHLLEFYGVTEVDTGNFYTKTSLGFILDFNDLEPNEEEKVKIHMNAPLIQLGTIITNVATYIGEDIFVENNTSFLNQIVIGSYDPNDILESHGPEILHSSFETTDYLYYTVRFQNVGTADAVNVAIDNTLDARLDKSTIQMLSSSHNNVFTRKDNQLNWQFDNIHLPSEDMDEPNSHGYVYYKIKPLAGYSVGDIIPNTAEIYFDFNPAVVTNTFETEFTTTLSNANFSDIGFSIYPNPTSHFFELNFNQNINKTIKINIYDIQGKSVYAKTKEITETSFRMNVSELSKGMYFLKVNNGISETTKKLIVK